MSSIIKKRVLALDVGDARIGIALSDPLGITVQPLKTLERGGVNLLLRIIDTIREHDVGTVVVGMPYELDGTVGEQAQKVERFIVKLRRRITNALELQDVSVLAWDERLSSVEAEKVIAGSRLRNAERHAAVDRISAAIILDSYLDSLRIDSARNSLPPGGFSPEE